MSPVKLQWDGLAEFREDFRRLPKDLKGEGVEIVRAQAEMAGAEIRSRYGVWTGALRRGVRVTAAKGTPWGVRYVVKSIGSLAWLYENGSQTRQYITTHGKTKTVGKMPAGHVFIPAVMRARLRIRERLANLLVRFGLGVTVH